MILQVLGGTANVGSGVLTVRCSAVAADSAVAKVATLVELVSRQTHMELHHCSECAQGRDAMGALQCVKSLYFVVMAIVVLLPNHVQQQSRCHLCCVYVVGYGSTVQE